MYAVRRIKSNHIISCHIISNHRTLHYTTLHYITLQYATLHFIWFDLIWLQPSDRGHNTSCHTSLLTHFLSSFFFLSHPVSSSSSFPSCIFFFLSYPTSSSSFHLISSSSSFSSYFFLYFLISFLRLLSHSTLPHPISSSLRQKDRQRHRPLLVGHLSSSLNMRK